METLTVKYEDGADVFFDRIRPEKLELKQSKQIDYYNVACSFDIETTSTYIDGVKTAFMYIWQFDFDGNIIYGRTVSEMVYFFNRLASHLQLSKSKRLIIYVHNLAHEFAFICKYFTWQDVFSIDLRKVINAVTDNGLNFKCSYVLTNMNLATVAKNLTTPMKKLTGDLDYTLLRLPCTPLTDNELAYCLEDVRIVVALIRERMGDAKGDITKIPLTATGYVRNAVRNNCLNDYKKGDGRGNKHGDKTYTNLIRSLTLDPGEYVLNKKAFAGGFTHANALNVNKTHKNVYSYDITSSYPAVMLSEMFPMSKGVKTTYTDRETFEHDLRAKCMVFTITLKNVELKLPFGECYISQSKCDELNGAVINNGRIASADRLTTTVTNIDFGLIRQIYNFSIVQIGDCYTYEKDYLPGKFIKSILDFYVNKTKLKGVKGSEKEYMNSKGLLNSCYGMTVTDIVRDNIIYDNATGWEQTPGDGEKQINTYNSSRRRFLFYPWGVFVTAYARRNLFALITETGDDFIYSDTDSVKFVNIESHKQFIEDYNKHITKKIRRCLQRSKLDPDLASPKDINGIEHPLGVYDCETVTGYEKFKTLGAKRYMYTDKDGLHITIAGVNKKAGAVYLGSFDDPYKMFTNELIIPGDGTGKLTHTYLDYEMNGELTDYLGNTGKYTAKSGVHLEPCDYSLTIAETYKNYIANIQTKYYQ